MDWTRHHTAFHICGALQFYATQLAVGSPEFAPTVRLNPDAMNAEDLPGLLKSQSILLAQVARGVAKETRGFHSAGKPDAEGFLAMGCAELLLHCWDAVAGTDIKFTPDETVADHVLQRLFPWAPADTPRWQTLLWATGRGELEGHEPVGITWMWHNAPLDEWDGTVRQSTDWVGR
jgi:hypothetical protein